MSELDKNEDVVEGRGKPISELRVHELKAELEKRSLSSAGVKAVLTARLNKALRDEGVNTDEHRFFVNRTPTTSPSKPRGRPSAKVAKMVEEPKPEVEEKKVVEEEEEDVVLTRSVPSSPEPDELRIIEDSFELEEHMMKEKDAVVEEPKIEEPKVEEPKAEEPVIKELTEPSEPTEHEKNEEKAELQKDKDAKEIAKETTEPIDEQVVEPSKNVNAAEEKLAEPVKEPEIIEPTRVEEKVEEPSSKEVEADKKIDDDDEEVEGEDEFEEIEPAEQPQKEQKSVENSQCSPADDEIFLEEEDLLEDPLDEPLTESKTSTTTSIVSVNAAAAAAHCENSSASDTSLFGDEAKKTSIWIRGMTPSTKASSVKQLASQFGKVIQSKIFNSKPINGEIKNCFALVTFVETESMETAISTLHRKEHDGRILRVEKVADSHLTGTAERIAKENEEKKKREEEAKRQEQRKKRAVIQAPESPKKPRQTIQAPEPNRKNRAIIQAPERSRSRESRQRERKPITFESSKEETKRPEKKNEKRNETDSRRIIAPARGSRVTPPRTSRVRDEPHQPSLIISARVDTSGCRGGPIKRSVERTVPSNISTSELRRKQPSNQQSRSFSRSRVDFPDDGDHYSNPRQRAGRSPQPRLQSYPSRNDHYEGPIVYHDSRDRRESSRGDREREKQREREMIEIIRRKEEEHRLREEKLQIEREREKMRFEHEKLERAKLELELTKQKLALQQAAAYARSSGDRTRGESSRRRHIEDTRSSGPRAKIHVDDRRSGSTSSRREAIGGRHATIPSARHVATEYGIQSNLGNSTSSLQTTSPARVNNYSSPSKVYDQRTSSNYRSGGNAYEMSNNYQGYQSSVPNRYADNSYQQQVWAGLDSNGQMTMETHWTADSASASSSATSTAGWQQQQYSNNNRNGRDYGYTRNHY